MRGRPKTAKGRAWRRLVKKYGVMGAVKMRRRGSKLRRRHNPRGWFDSAKKHGKASRKGWKIRRSGRKGYAKARGRRGKRFLRNPFAVGGPKGRFELIPSMRTIQGAAIRGGGAALSEVLRATGYSLIGRNIQAASIVEDLLGRMVSGALLGVASGYVLGGGLAAQMVEGSYTVAFYQAFAEVAGKLTGGQPKILGFVANPFRDSGKPYLPGFSFGAASAASGVAGLGVISPEGQILPMGAVVPEGQILPMGEEMQLSGSRFKSRF